MISGQQRRGIKWGVPSFSFYIRLNFLFQVTAFCGSTDQVFLSTPPGVVAHLFGLFWSIVVGSRREFSRIPDANVFQYECRVWFSREQLGMRKMSLLQTLPIHRLSLKSSWCIVFCFLLCWLGRHELRAQQILIRMGGENPNLENYNQLNGVLENRRDAARNRIKSHLLDIDRVCELSPKQRTRLEVAGKGAVVSYSDRIAEELTESARKIGVEFQQGNPPKEDPDDEDAAVGQGLTVMNFDEDNKLTIDSERIWVASVRKTLTESQAKKLKAWTIARQKMIQQAAVDHLIARADLKMFLSRQQREKLKAYVDQEYGPQLVKQMKAPPKQNRRMFLELPRQRVNVTVDGSVKEILSDSQLEIWKMDFQVDLNMLENE